VEPPLWAPRRVNRPSKHSDGRLSLRALLLLGCVVVFGCEGNECVPRVHKAHSCGQEGGVAVIASWAGGMNVYPGYTKPQLMWSEQWLPNPRPTDVGQLRPVLKKMHVDSPHFLLDWRQKTSWKSSQVSISYFW
jgi:hypothetical protein